MSSKKKTVLLFALLLAFLLFYFLRGDYSIKLSLGDHSLNVDGPEGYLYSVDFQQIDSIVYSDTWEAGDCLSGGTKYGYQFGTWDTDQVGQYQLCVMKRNSGFIVVTTTEGDTLVFNLENTDTTMEFYKALVQYLSDEGYHMTVGEL
jgi:hypothetical protein